jgi:hypothetical protein
LKFLSDRWRFCLQFSLVAVLLSSLTVYGLGRLAFNLHMDQIFGSACAFSALFMLSAPLIYWARGYATREPADFRPLTFVLGMVFLSILLLGDFEGMRFGIIQPDTAKGYALTCVIGGPAIFVMALYAHKHLYRTTHHK